MARSVLFAGCILILAGLAARPASEPELTLPTLKQPVEILWDRWGVPHIYAKDQYDLFFAQGWTAAHDRLFQLDLWRRVGTGHLAEVLGPAALARDRFARLMRYRGDWDKEWQSYGPDAKEIATAFTDGINAYILSLDKHWPVCFKIAGYGPDNWKAEDVTARIAGLGMSHNVMSERQRAQDVVKFGLEKVQTVMPPDPARALDPPPGIDLASLTPAILHDYRVAVGNIVLTNPQGSNNWVVDGTMSATGAPLLANDPHRALLIPSLRKTVHLSAPGWDVIGAGEPALPGVAIGHNANVAWGLTIVGTDQQDLYIEQLNPDSPNQYRYKSAWKDMDVEHEQIAVKGQEKPTDVELQYTVHGPVIYEDNARHVAYALRWVGSEPGGAGYLASLALDRVKSAEEFRTATARFKIPSENLVYADTSGNIGWIAAGVAPIRPNWSGLFPAPGGGDYEWSGYIASDKMPQAYNPPSHHIATSNNNILPKDYPHPLSYEWAPPFRVERVEELLHAHKHFTTQMFEHMQQDVMSIPARKLMALAGPDSPLAGWDARLRVDSPQALLYEAWAAELPRMVFGPELGARAGLPRALAELEAHPNPKAIADSLAAAQGYLKGIAAPGGKRAEVWGDVHKTWFIHPLNRTKLNRGPYARPGDGYTVNAGSGPNFRDASGASFREIIDVSDWDKSVVTNTPGESGNPLSKHYDDLTSDWQWGMYHRLPFSRRAVEAATEQRLTLLPRK